MNHPYSFQPQIMPHLHQQPGGGALNISDHSSAAAVAAAMSQMSPPNQFRKLPLNMQTNRPPDGLMSDQAAAAAYMSWHNQQSQQHSSYTPHSSTPPPTSSPMTRQLTPGGAMQYQYESGGGLIIPASQLQHQSQQMLDNTSQKLSNESKFWNINTFYISPIYLNETLHTISASNTIIYAFCFQFYSHPTQMIPSQVNYSLLLFPMNLISNFTFYSDTLDCSIHEHCK